MKYTHKLDIKNVEHYSMDGCENGDLVEITGIAEENHEEFWVNVLRKDGTMSEDFLVDSSDLKKLI